MGTHIPIAGNNEFEGLIAQVLLDVLPNENGNVSLRVGYDLRAFWEFRSKSQTYGKLTEFHFRRHRVDTFAYLVD